jgi:hypothetical protein
VIARHFSENALFRFTTASPQTLGSKTPSDPKTPPNVGRTFELPYGFLPRYFHFQYTVCGLTSAHVAAGNANPPKEAVLHTGAQLVDADVVLLQRYEGGAVVLSDARIRAFFSPPNLGGKIESIDITIRGFCENVSRAAVARAHVAWQLQMRHYLSVLHQPGKPSCFLARHCFGQCVPPFH